MPLKKRPGWGRFDGENMTDIALTVFQGRTADRNDRARPAALAIGQYYSKELGLIPSLIGSPNRSANGDWRVELEAATPELLTLSSQFQTIMTLGKRPLAAIGRCATALATIPAVAGARPDAVIVWIDAHCDLNTPETSQSGYLGGMALAGPAGLWDSGLGSGLDLSNIVLVGARDFDPAEKAMVDEGKVRVVTPGWGMAKNLERILDGRPAYVHVDCDVLKPNIVPTEYAPPGGMSLRELRHAAKAIAKNEVVGLEIAELQTPETGDLKVSPLLKSLAPLVRRMRD